MKRKLFAALSGFILLLASAIPARPAAAFVVFDPSNFAQNILQAIRMLQSNINEARMIANQITSLANEVKNLTSLPFDILDDFNTQFTNLFSTMGTINGLMQNLTTLQARFEELYPEFSQTYDPVSRASVAEAMTRMSQSTREMMLGAVKTGAQVLDSMPQTQAQLDKLMSDSQSAVGILQAAQAGNQIAGTISGNLMNINAQLAAYTQAHTAFLMEVNEASAAAKNRMDHVLDGWGNGHDSRPIQENPF